MVIDSMFVYHYVGPDLRVEIVRTPTFLKGGEVNFDYLPRRGGSKKF